MRYAVSIPAIGILCKQLCKLLTLKQNIILEPFSDILDHCGYFLIIFGQKEQKGACFTPKHSGILNTFCEMYTFYVKSDRKLCSMSEASAKFIILVYSYKY